MLLVRPISGAAPTQWRSLQRMNAGTDMVREGSRALGWDIIGSPKFDLCQDYVENENEIEIGPNLQYKF